MRYNLGYMDKYPIEAAGSTIENNPMYRVLFKDPIDLDKLEASIRKGMKAYPLFATRVEFDHEYYLRSNKRPLIILECSEQDRPKNFGKSTNDYPWRMCVDGRRLIFEWLHGVSDGVGALAFLKYVICMYFDVEVNIQSENLLLAPGIEPFVDKSEKGIDYTIDPPGFSIKDFPKLHGGYMTDCHFLTADTQEILKVARECKSSVAPVISVLWARALRMHLPEKAKNKNVACNIVMDLRRPLKHVTIHNCVEYKRITYIDYYDDMTFAGVAREYKAKLDNARLIPNVVRAISDRMKLFKAYHLFKSKRFLKFAVKMIGVFMKESDCNFVLTYPGKIELPPEVGDRIEDLDFKVWHDFGECILAAVDFNGHFNINACENFVEKGVVEDFIKLSEEVGIHWTETGCNVFEQAHFEE